MRRLAVVVAVVVVTLVRPLPARADPALPASTVSYRPPVDAPVIDPYRPPPQPWEAGNRGIDYGTVPGTPVAAAADGEVVFAGQVGGTLHVVVLHADGIRTSYSFLRSISVARGDRVRQGDTVGTAGDDLHFGARVGGDYIDPTQLFDDGPPRVYLVPDEDRRPGSEAKERSGVERLLAGIKRVVVAPASVLSWARAGGADALHGVTDAVDKSVQQLQVAARLAQEADPTVHALRVLQSAVDWYGQRGNCTPASTPGPRLGERHLAVRVGGWGSSSETADIDKLDVKALNYDPADVVRFSYRGGAVKGDGPENPYTKADSSGDLRTAAFRLRQLLERLGREHPGVPIDILAHSQGGLVARQALAHETDTGDGALPPINALVMLGTPNQGADVATIGRMLDRTTPGRVGENVADALRPQGVKVEGTAVQQLAEGSDFLTKLNATPLPPGVKVTSIGARGDFVVPSARTHLDGARNVVVAPPGLSKHGELPGSAAAQREVALALAGRPPTCRSLGDMVLDGAISDAITTNEDALGLVASLAAGATSPPPPPPLPPAVPSPPKEP
jgi:hypothetical protein